MQVKLSKTQHLILKEWFADLTTEEILCVVGYILLGIPARDMAEAMGMGGNPKKIWRIARRGVAKSHIYIRADKGTRYETE